MVIAITCVAGYLAVGAVMSVILAAVTVHNGEADGAIVVLGSLFWWITLVVMGIIGVCKLGSPLGRFARRAWEAGVRRLNPEYKGF